MCEWSRRECFVIVFEEEIRLHCKVNYFRLFVLIFLNTNFLTICSLEAMISLPCHVPLEDSVEMIIISFSCSQILICTDLP